MKAVSSWSFAPYTPLHRPERARGPYVTRLAPFAGGFRADFINNAAPGSLHTVRCGKRDGELTMTMEAADHAVFEGLEDGEDYRFEVAPNPVPALRSRTEDNTSIGRVQGVGC